MCSWRCYMRRVCRVMREAVVHGVSARKLNLKVVGVLAFTKPNASWRVWHSRVCVHYTKGNQRLAHERATGLKCAPHRIIIYLYQSNRHITICNTSSSIYFFSDNTCIVAVVVVRCIPMKDTAQHRVQCRGLVSIALRTFCPLLSTLVHTLLCATKAK